MAVPNHTTHPGIWLPHNSDNNANGLILGDVRLEAEKRKWGNVTDVNFIDEFPASKQLHREQTESTVNSDLENHDNSSQRNSDGTELSEQDVRQRRKDQNRAAQRAFRERKERYVKELEAKIKQMEKDHKEMTDKLQNENEGLRDTIKRMETEMYTLKGAAIAFDLSVSKLREAGIDIASPLREVSPPVTDPNRSPVRFPDRPSPDQVLLSAADLGVSRERQVPDPILDAPFYYPEDSPSGSSSRLLSECSATEHTDCEKQLETLVKVEDQEFAARSTKRFEHIPDPAVLNATKVIPYDEVWDRLAEHPKFEDCNIELLCEEVKKKAKCSGTGAVIVEEEFQQLIQKLENNMQ